MVSIITCIYNQNPKYFMECIKSVGYQEGPIEWIIIDDGSDDIYYEAYLECFNKIKIEHKIKFIKLHQNMGLSYARNQGIQYAQHEWIVVLDSDDQLDASLTKYIKKLPSTATMASFSVEFFDDKNVEYRPISKWRDLYCHFGKTFVDPFLWFDFYYHGIIAKKEILLKIGGYNNNIKIGEDQDILLRTCEALPLDAVIFCDEIGYRYRNNHKGVCVNQWATVEKNYCITMLSASRRRGSMFNGCKYTKTICIDNAMIDTYTYKLDNNWMTWNTCLKRYFGKKLTNKMSLIG